MKNSESTADWDNYYDKYSRKVCTEYTEADNKFRSFKHEKLVFLCSYC